MTEATTQTAVEKTKVTTSSVTEGTGARNDGDDLDALLAEFDQGTKTTTETKSPPTKTATTTTVDPNLAARIQHLEGVVTKYENNTFKAEISETVKEIRGDLDAEFFPDDLVEAWLDSRARKDPRLQQAWLQKEGNPQQWGRIRSQLGREFKKKFEKMPDPAVTEDRNAVVAAVRGSSNKAPADTPTNYSKMSTAEYRNSIREQYGFDPGV
jgi:hypothetical protein